MSPSSPARDVVPLLAAALREGANSGGGWGYTPGRHSRVEPTSWALLALGGQAASPGGWSAAPHIAFLRSAQIPSGLLRDVPDELPNYAFSALATLAVRGRVADPTASWLRRLIESLIVGHGVALPASGSFRQDNSLRAWPWVNGCFSWVEPTSWCLLALKRARAALADPRVDVRIAEAERLLADRCCAQGGWNYGNANVLGQRLEPYVATTAVALLALQDRRDHPAVERSLGFLQAHAGDEPSGLALALAVICLGVFGQPTAGIERDLADTYARTGFLGNQHAMAMALYALAHAPLGHEAFRV
jgi:hypothetical protein